MNIHRSQVFSIISSLIMGGVVLATVANRQLLIDQITVWQERPSRAVQLIIDDIGLTEKGKFLMLASRPTIDDRETFNKSCINNKEDSSTAILGCYVYDRIHIYNVTDERLDGIRTVTAAHELLHAAYARLNNAERAEVNSMITDAYQKVIDQKTLATRMAVYDTIEPGQRYNELHSILATEVEKLDQPLENYYGRYFTSRQSVAAKHARYQSVFTALSTRSEQIVTLMNELAQKIEQNTAEYNRTVSQLNTDIGTFNARAKGGGYSSQAVFDNERQVLIDRTSDLSRLKEQVNTDIAYYNELKKELSDISNQNDGLNRSIDSKLSPLPSV